jgi:putative nucleotidyltransferase with HDIG domain
MPNQDSRQPRRRTIYLIFLVLISAALALFALMLPSLTRSFASSLQVGQVATKDYRAPTDITYTSDVLTEQRRDKAEEAIQPVYTEPDTSIARQQLEALRAAMAYISSVRADSYADINQKIDDLAALEGLNLSQSTAYSLLTLSDTRWQIIQQEAISVLEKVMSLPIRPENVENARETLPNLVSLTLPEDQIILVTELTTPFVIPNSQYSESLTFEAQEKARESVTPVTRDFSAGEIVVRGGHKLTAADIEALEKLGVVESQLNWKDWFSAGALVLAIVAMVVLFLLRNPDLTKDLRGLTINLILFFIFLYIARLVIPAHTVIPYAFPLSAFGLTIAALFGLNMAIIFAVPLAILTAYGLPNTLDLTLYFLLGSLMAILVLQRANRLANFFWAGAAFTLTGILTLIAYRLLLPNSDMVGMATLAGAALFNGLVTASLAILMQFFLAQFLGMTTSMQLMDLTRPDHPLLQFILREAPGTYQHSLQVANLAEQTAEKIGADPLLTRVGALYHDAGKARYPVFFIENQAPGFPNPHDNLDPETSSQIIIRHVEDGLRLGQKYHLPKRVLDFISEHHGTMLTRYQYVNAVKEAGGDESLVDKSKFRYPGPRPQSRETAILMLADGCEARVRAERPADEEQLRAVIKQVIDNRVASGQLDDTELTLHDLNVILESFTATLKGIYHPRVKYPQLDQADQPEIRLLGPNEETVPLPSSKKSRDEAQLSANHPIDTTTP